MGHTYVIKYIKNWLILYISINRDGFLLLSSFTALSTLWTRITVEYNFMHYNLWHEFIELLCKLQISSSAILSLCASLLHAMGTNSTPMTLDLRPGLPSMKPNLRRMRVACGAHACVRHVSPSIPRQWPQRTCTMTRITDTKNIVYFAYDLVPVSLNDFSLVS